MDEDYYNEKLKYISDTAITLLELYEEAQISLIEATYSHPKEAREAFDIEIREFRQEILE